VGLEMNSLVECEEAVRMMKETSKYIEDIVKSVRPDLLNTFYTYSNEAIQARKILSQDLLNLNYGDAILEVGAGILALSTQLSREGFNVTAVEPIQEGFEEIDFIMNLYITLSINDGISFKLVNSQIELCEFTEKFDYIFAFNVFEHISKPYEVVKQLKGELKQNSSLRILCPNYNFPYEPHFQRILFLRKNKAFFLPDKNYINKKDTEYDSFKLYKSLNFISYKTLLLFLIENQYIYVVNKNAFYELLIRANNDSMLASRHKAFFRIVKLFYKSRLIGIAKYFPYKLAPLIDLKIINRKIT